MEEIQFIPQASLVFAHPLLKNVTLFNLPNELDENYEEKKESEVDIPEANGADFLDPLGVSHSVIKLELDMTKIQNIPRPVKDVGESRLDNTLAEKPEDFIPDLDPRLPGFRPWSEFREIILENFKTSDLLTLESSFLESFNKNQRWVYKILVISSAHSKS